MKKIITITLSMLFFSLAISPALAASYTVNIFTETDYDGSCSATDCTLREAINEANFNSGADTIVLSAGTYTTAISGTSENSNSTGDYDITDTSGATTISGAGASSTLIDANDLDRVFDVRTNASLIMSNVTVTNGTATSGSAIYCSNGSMTISNATISNSISSTEGGGLQAEYCNLSITNAVVTNNTGYDGGGIYVHWASSDTISITDSVVSSNTANASGGGTGGGILLYGETGSSTATLSGLTINNNINTPSDNGQGGGLYILGPVNVTNSTIYGNSAYYGGGVYIRDTNDVNVKIAHTTITNNSATNQGGGIYNNNDASGTESIKNSIIANNTATSSGPDCAAESGETITSGDYNIISDTSGCSAWSSGVHDQTDTDPLMASDNLADNGGDLNTVALQPTSPAKDAVPSASCTDASSAALTEDQRGFTRPENSNCDIGAYELDQTDPTITATTGDDTVECAAETWTDAGSNVTDNADSLFDTLVATANGTVTEETLGNYSITYNATDHDSNSGTATRTVTVSDTTVPAITINGSTSVTINQGEAYIDAGATAADTCDSTITVATNNPVDTNTPGTYTVTYTAADDSNNAAAAKTRTVTVVASEDDDAPDEDEDEDPADPEIAGSLILSVQGLAQGKIKVTYADSTEYIYTVFSDNSTAKETKVRQISNTAYYVVLQALGKKLALVNVLNGEVLSRKALGKKKYQKNSLKLFTLRKGITVAATSKNNKHRARLAIIKVKVNYTLGKKVAANLTSKTLKVAKTGKKNNNLLLKSAKGKIIRKYLVTKKLKLRRKN